MTQPAMWRADLTEPLLNLLWMGGVGDFQTGKGHEYYTPAALASALDSYNATLLEVCRQTSVECIDLAAMLPKDETTFYDDVHFNETGSRRVAQVVADYLLRQP